MDILPEPTEVESAGSRHLTRLHPARANVAEEARERLLTMLAANNVGFSGPANKTSDGPPSRRRDVSISFHIPALPHLLLTHPHLQ